MVAVQTAINKKEVADGAFAHVPRQVTVLRKRLI
jgi:hypothetical protein